MAIEVMDRHASDNRYLHRDFHISCDLGIAYIGSRYGEKGVREYLIQYTDAYLSPLADSMSVSGLKPFADYLKRIYEAEEASSAIHMDLTENELIVTTDSSPAVTAMKKAGYEQSAWNKLTAPVIYGRLAEKSGFLFEMQYYDESTGASHFRLFRKAGPK